jgi:hypothetical protein
MNSPFDYRIVLCEGRSRLAGIVPIGPRRWWWRLESTENGQILATSEMYSSRQKQEQTVARLSTVLGISIGHEEK